MTLSLQGARWLSSVLTTSGAVRVSSAKPFPVFSPYAFLQYLLLFSKIVWHSLKPPSYTPFTSHDPGTVMHDRFSRCHWCETPTILYGGANAVSDSPNHSWKTGAPLRSSQRENPYRGGTNNEILTTWLLFRLLESNSFQNIPKIIVIQPQESTETGRRELDTSRELNFLPISTF